MTMFPEPQLGISDKIALSEIAGRVGPDKVLEYLLTDWLVRVRKFGGKDQKFYDGASDTMLETLSKVMHDNEVRNR